MTGPLQGVRVLDLSRVLAGPFGTSILAALGAAVLKIEDPAGGDGVRSIGPHYDGDLSHYFLTVNRGKKSIAVDMKSEAGRDLILRLAEISDVVVENFRPDVLERLGLDFPVLKAVNPRIILCSISGFGRNGPLRDSPSFDLVTQARSGVMSITGEVDGPPTKMGLPMGDLGGGLWSAIAVLAALQRRNTDDRAQHIDISLLDGLMGLLGYLSQMTLLTGRAPERMGSDHHAVVPYGRFEAADGYLVLALHVGNFWRRFCTAIGRTDLIEDERFRTTALRRKNRDVLVPLLEDVLRTKTRAEWDRILSEADVPQAPVLDVKEALEQPQVAARGLLRTVDDPDAGEITVVGSPIRFVGDDATAVLPTAPRLGQHTRSALSSLLGMNADEIDALIASGAITEERTLTEEGASS
ncbi:MAG TPA: CoA transferase [Actinopolymorphaceae bacterium]